MSSVLPRNRQLFLHLFPLPIPRPRKSARAIDWQLVRVQEVVAADDAAQGAYPYCGSILRIPIAYPYIVFPPLQSHYSTLHRL